MRLVLYTSEDSLDSELFLYMFSHLASLGFDTYVLAVRKKETPWRLALRRYTRKFRMLGFGAGLEIVASMPIQRIIERRNNQEILRRLSALRRSCLKPARNYIQFVDTVNGPDAVTALEALQPDILVQAGAGLLKQQIFSIPRLGTLNMHHGIAPLIRGMNSIYWALWENRPDWIGATIHMIDEGIDTGRPMAHFRIEQIEQGEGFPSLFVKATEGGMTKMLEVIRKLVAGEDFDDAPPMIESNYRSTLSGFKMLLIELRLRKSAN